MFCGTLRENVDPMRLYSDEAVKDALVQAGVGGKSLDAVVGVSGQGWSIGEKQLVSSIVCMIAVDWSGSCFPVCETPHARCRCVSLECCSRSPPCSFLMKQQRLWMRRPKLTFKRCSKKNSSMRLFFASRIAWKRFAGAALASKWAKASYCRSPASRPLLPRIWNR
jgi:hypothetical protein